jgi:hypothetical protein
MRSESLPSLVGLGGMKNSIGPKQGDDNFGRPLPKDRRALETEIKKYRDVTHGAGNQRSLALAESQEYLGDLLHKLGTLTKEHAHFIESRQAYIDALSAFLIYEIGSLN